MAMSWKTTHSHTDTHTMSINSSLHFHLLCWDLVGRRPPLWLYSLWVFLGHFVVVNAALLLLLLLVLFLLLLLLLLLLICLSAMWKFACHKLRKRVNRGLQRGGEETTRCCKLETTLRGFNIHFSSGDYPFNGLTSKQPTTTTTTTTTKIITIIIKQNMFKKKLKQFSPAIHSP